MGTFVDIKLNEDAGRTFYYIGDYVISSQDWTEVDLDSLPLSFWDNVASAYESGLIEVDGFDVLGFKKFAKAAGASFDGGGEGGGEGGDFELPLLDAITEADVDSVVDKFNSLVADLIAKGYMNPPS